MSAHDAPTTMQVALLTGAERVARAHHAAGQQLDNLCGAHWVAILVRSAGAGEPSAEEAALAAASVLPAASEPEAYLPRGAASKSDYTLPIPTVDDQGASGTSVHGVIVALEQLSGGRLRAVPIRGTGIEASDVDRLLDLLLARPAWGAVPLLNVRTGRLWGAGLALADAIAFLGGEEISPPAPDWDVGHFVAVAGVVRRPPRSLVLVRDSYPGLGWDGHHLQPAEAVAAALRRDDGREGGLLVVVSSGITDEVERELKETGFEIGTWDNGTPYEQGGSR